MPENRLHDKVPSNARIMKRCVESWTTRNWLVTKNHRYKDFTLCQIGNDAHSSVNLAYSMNSLNVFRSSIEANILIRREAQKVFFGFDKNNQNSAGYITSNARKPLSCFKTLTAASGQCLESMIPRRHIGPLQQDKTRSSLCFPHRRLPPRLVAHRLRSPVACRPMKQRQM